MTNTESVFDGVYYTHIPGTLNALSIYLSVYPACQFVIKKSNTSVII